MSIVLPDKTVVVPKSLILPDNTVTPIPEDGYTGSNGEKVDGNGEVLLLDGTVITPNGVERPDGSYVKPEEPYQIPADKKTAEETSPAGSAEDNNESSETAASRPEESRPAATPSSEAGGNAQTEAPTSSGEGGDTQTETATSSEAGGDIPSRPSESSKPSSEPEDQGKLGAESENAGGWAVWKNQSNIDLFYNRTGGTADKIQPGSSGFYRFRLKNTRSKELQITLTLSEDRLHIPLELTLTPLDTHGNRYGTGVTGAIVNGTLVLKGSIEAKAEITYQLDWKWPADGSDEADTAAGTDGGDYIVNLRILAEERA